VVDIETGKEFDADPKYFFTTSIPWDLGESEDTPQLDKYIMEWVVKEGLQDKSYVHTMYEIIAYCCLNNQFLQTMFGLTGSGSNGKSTFEDVLKKFVGKKNCVNSEMKLLSKQFETSALYRKSVCFIPEVDTYDMKNSNRVKQLTGEKELRYEFKGKTSFTEDSVTKLIVLTNSLPVTNDRSVAFYRRWLIVDFPHIFPVGKDVLADIPDVEYNNLARKCLRIMKDLKGKKTFTNGGNYEERKKRYEDRSNPIEKFINEKCNLEEPLVPIPSIGFYKECNKWLKSQGMRELRNSDIKEALKTMDIYVGAKSQRDGSDVIRLSGVWLSWKEEVQKTLKQ
jgi:putative DNA primase/helicase